MRPRAERRRSWQWERLICYFPDSVIVIELFVGKFWWMDILVFLKFVEFANFFLWVTSEVREVF